MNPLKERIAATKAITTKKAYISFVTTKMLAISHVMTNNIPPPPPPSYNVIRLRLRK